MFLIYLTWRVRQTSDPELKASMFFSQCFRAKLALLSIRQKLPQLAALSSDAPLRTRRRRAAVPVSPRRPGPRARSRPAPPPRCGLPPPGCLRRGEARAQAARRLPRGHDTDDRAAAPPCCQPAGPLPPPPAPTPPPPPVRPSVRPSLPRPCPRRPCRTSAAGAAGSGRCLPLSAPVPLALGAGPAPPPAPASACGWRRVLSQALLDFLLLLESREVGV